MSYHIDEFKIYEFIDTRGISPFAARALKYWHEYLKTEEYITWH